MFNLLHAHDNFAVMTAVLHVLERVTRLCQREGARDAYAENATIHQLREPE